MSVVIIAFALLFAMGSLLASQLTQLAGDLPRYQSTISEKIQSFRNTTAGRGTLERASLGQLSTAHGLGARVEAADALSTANIFRLEIAGVAIVCLIYMGGGSPAHMRYSVRRLRRKLPKATIILGCWLKDMEPAALETLRESAKADLAVATLGEAIKLCIGATCVEDHSTF